MDNTATIDNNTVLQTLYELYHEHCILERSTDGDTAAWHTRVLASLFRAAICVNQASTDDMSALELIDDIAVTRSHKWQQGDTPLPQSLVT